MGLVEHTQSCERQEWKVELRTPERELRGSIPSGSSV